MSVNKVILVGNLGKDPELRYTPSGAAVASFSLATSERYKDRNGEWVDKTEWHNIVAWRNLAEICGKYLHKGKQVYIEGKIQTRSYDDRDGNRRYMTEIIADQMQMLGRAGEENGYAPRNDSRQQRQPQQSYNQPQAQPQQSYNQAPAQGGASAYDDQVDPPFNPDDDIPF